LTSPKPRFEKHHDEIHVSYAALEKWGWDKQLDMAVEELSELTKALVKYRRHNNNPVWRVKVLEEVADVQLVLRQIRLTLESKKEKGEFARILKNKIENLWNIIHNDDPLRGLKEAPK
jgi:hypothetical protein